MPETSSKNIRIPVKGEEGKHSGHKIRTINISSKEGIKALYCIDCKKIITYIFAKNKDWTTAKAKKWVLEHESMNKNFKENYVDQMEDFISLTATYETGVVKVFVPNSEAFILNEEIEDFTMGQDCWEESGKARGEGQGQGRQVQRDGGASGCVCPKCGATYTKVKGEPCSNKTCPSCGVVLIGKNIEETESNESINIIKIDKAKQIVYGAYLVPEEADWDGDVISEEDIEKVAHDFLVEYRVIDEMHKDIIKADIVESMIAWDDIDFRGKKIAKGTWIGAIKVHDKNVWEKIELGEYKAFSVQIAGIRQPINTEDN